MIGTTTATDKAGRIYKKIFSNQETEAIYCNKGENTSLLTESNFSIRTGESKFGDQLILQFVIKKVLETYKAKSPLIHIETYFPINNDTLELFEGITEYLKKELKGGKFI